MCHSMSFLLAGNWDAATIFLLSVFAKVNKVYQIEGIPEGTYDKIWIYQVHSFIGLFNGIHQPLDPYNDPWPAGSGASKYAGKPVCGGHFRGCVYLLAQDREYSANELGCPHWQSNECCLWCPADRNRFNVRSVGPHAPWKAHLYPPGPADRKGFESSGVDHPRRQSFQPSRGYDARRRPMGLYSNCTAPH